MITHAYVSYEDDRKFAVVSVDDIEDFDPLHENDFSVSAFDSTKWTDLNGSSDYYRARILVLGDSEKDVQAKVNRKRVRVNKIFDTSESEDDILEQKKKRKIKVNRCTEPVQYSSGEGQPKPSADQHNDAAGYLKGMIKQKDTTIRLLRSEIEEKDVELQRLRQLNMALQDKMLRRFDDNEDCQVVSRSFCAQKIHEGGHSVFPAPELLPPREATPEPQLPSTADNKMVNIGQGLQIQQEVWERVQGQQKDSMFVKELLVSIWTKEQLRHRSLQGKQCPRFPGKAPKTPLTPWKVGVVRCQWYL
ncbi:uncharacterized protein LOC135373600 [Ornithodoros turicata]|uniref:uncharacterized protein LOC135373600 n=1 Tax=Ornithodoros turicata TaxID=34597 RepID=UPI0031389C76